MRIILKNLDNNIVMHSDGYFSLVTKIKISQYIIYNIILKTPLRS